ncbi:TPA: hNH endonuclease [Escherichia coli]|nr:hNH endonuclease [Escherichia coli]
MKQMSLIEMDGFLKGKFIPRDLKVNETNAEYLVRKFAEAEAKISALSEDQQRAIESIKQAYSAVKLAHEKFSALAAENAMLKQRTQQLIDIISNTDNDYCMCGSAMKDHVHSGCGYPTGMFDYYYNQWLESDNKTPATDAFLAEVRANDLNAFIRHHSAELDAHIKNGGEQFDEKSVRIRDIIVSARLFREQIRKEAAQ